MNFLDDIMVHGRTKQEHDERLHKVLKRLANYNMYYTEWEEVHIWGNRGRIPRPPNIMPRRGGG